MNKTIEQLEKELQHWIGDSKLIPVLGAYIDAKIAAAMKDAKPAPAGESRLNPCEIVEMIISGHFGSPNSLMDDNRCREWPQVRPALTSILALIDSQAAELAALRRDCKNKMDLLKDFDARIIALQQLLEPGAEWMRTAATKIASDVSGGETVHRNYAMGAIIEAISAAREKAGVL